MSSLAAAAATPADGHARFHTAVKAGSLHARRSSAAGGQRELLAASYPLRPSAAERRSALGGVQLSGGQQTLLDAAHPVVWVQPHSGLRQAQRHSHSVRAAVAGRAACNAAGLTAACAAARARVSGAADCSSSAHAAADAHTPRPGSRPTAVLAASTATPVVAAAAVNGKPRASRVRRTRRVMVVSSTALQYLTVGWQQGSLRGSVVLCAAFAQQMLLADRFEDDPSGAAAAGMVEARVVADRGWAYHYAFPMVGADGRGTVDVFR